MSAVVAASPAPRRVKAPSWLDARLIVGVLVVLGSMLLGAKVVADAEHTYPVVSVSADLQPGTVLAASELSTVRVRLPAGARRAYVADIAAAVGQQLNRAVSGGELLPTSALGSPIAVTTVTIPIGPDDSPTLQAGQRITVWLSTKGCPSVVVAPDVTVQDVHDASGTAFNGVGGQDVIVGVASDMAARIVTALAEDGAIIRAGVLSGSASPDVQALAPISCAAGATGS